MKLRALVALLLFVLLPACHPKRPPAVSGPGGTATPATRPSEPPVSGSYGTQPVNGPDVQSVTEDAVSGQDFSVNDASGENGPLADVHFDYDQASLSDEARGILEKHALWLQSHRQAAITIEGHCDERGTAEYNLALGEQRARAALDYLRSLGVSGDRMKTVSYGKERPLDTGHGESAFARNRRAHFLVSR
jgi:peptidoglycan-associated lipoprotein